MVPVTVSADIAAQKSLVRNSEQKVLAASICCFDDYIINVHLPWQCVCHCPHLEDSGSAAGWRQKPCSANIIDI